MINKIKFFVLFIIFSIQLVFLPIQRVEAATSPSLGNAASFSVLAGLSMSAAGAGTTIAGDLGLSPGLASSRTGPWTVGGSEYFGTGGTSANAQTDALSAFNNLAGQTSDGPWSVSPWSPVPGVWTDTSSPAFTGTITLDGDYDDVWVFQVSTDFTFSGSVVLAGNAQACHVFWKISRSATIGSGSSFVGTLIASQDITLVSGASVNGRIIALNSSLTTDGNTISAPTCESAPTPTPTPTPSTSSSSTSSSSSSVEVCPALDYATPILLESRRVDADSVFIGWGPYSGTDRFNVRYGPSNGNWLYNTDVTGFSTTINDLPNNPFWFQVATRNNCAIGTYGEAKLVGQTGTVNSNVLGASIGLPNAGFGPQDK